MSHLSEMEQALGDLDRIRGILSSSCRGAKEEMERLSSMSETDVLGNWPNKRGLYSRAEHLFAEYKRGMCAGIAVVFVDLDKFKPINDKYGHAKGDEVIITLMGIVTGSLRKSDLFGRPSGDEVIMLLPNTTHDSAEYVLERIKIKFSQHTFPWNTAKIPVSLTYGIVTTYEHGDKGFEELLAMADDMVNSKKGDRSRA